MMKRRYVPVTLFAGTQRTRGERGGGEREEGKRFKCDRPSLSSPLSSPSFSLSASTLSPSSPANTSASNAHSASERTTKTDKSPFPLAPALSRPRAAHLEVAEVARAYALHLRGLHVRHAPHCRRLRPRGAARAKRRRLDALHPGLLSRQNERREGRRRRQRAATQGRGDSCGTRATGGQGNGGGGGAASEKRRSRKKKRGETEGQKPVKIQWKSVKNQCARSSPLLRQLAVEPAAERRHLAHSRALRFATRASLPAGPLAANIRQKPAAAARHRKTASAGALSSPCAAMRALAGDGPRRGRALRAAG